MRMSDFVVREAILPDLKATTKETVIRFFHGLAQINSRNGFEAFYCAKALRTSLSNEFQDGRWA